MKMPEDQGGNVGKNGEDRTPLTAPFYKPQLNTEQLKKYPWETHWLTGKFEQNAGDQYLEIIQKMDLYSSIYGFRKFPSKTHPEEIYSQPLNGTIYFVEGTNIGSDFGFPRNNMKKKYRWKKMNFTTDLPKKNPNVTYIVASAVRCQRINSLIPSESSIFRMHVVKAYKYKPHYPSYVLCHIRQLDIYNPSNKANSSNEASLSLRLQVQGLSLFPEPLQPLKYFNIFRIIHNMNQDLESSPESFSE